MPLFTEDRCRLFISIEFACGYHHTPYPGPRPARHSGKSRPIFAGMQLPVWGRPYLWSDFSAIISGIHVFYEWIFTGLSRNIREAMVFHPTMTGFRISRTIGRPSTRPLDILVDAAYDTTAIRTANRRRGTITIPVNPGNRTYPKRGRRYPVEKSDMPNGVQWSGSSVGGGYGIVPDPAPGPVQSGRSFGSTTQIRSRKIRGTHSIRDCRPDACPVSTCPSSPALRYP